MHNKTRFASVLAFILVFVSNSTYAHSKSDFHDAMRKLWEDHVTWTRLFIVSAAAGLPDKDATTQRLLQNQTDIGNAVADFYGRDANPKHWPEATLQSAMNTHLDQTLEEATHQLKGDYAASVKDYDHVVHHILGMADVLSDGIIAQFPAKFDKK